MLYLLLKFLHIMAAIVAVGANVTYGVWIARGKQQPEALGFALRGIRFIDNFLANPAYVALLISGLAMVHLAGYSLTTPWLLIALVLYALVALVGLLAFTPTLRRQIEALESKGPNSEVYITLATRSRRLGAAVGILVVAIVYLMVFKPT